MRRYGGLACERQIVDCANEVILAVVYKVPPRVVDGPATVVAAPLTYNTIVDSASEAVVWPAAICSSGWTVRSPMMNADLERKTVMGSRPVGCMVTIWRFGKRTVWLPSTITPLLSASWETGLPPNVVVLLGFRVLPGCTKAVFPLVG